MARGRVKGEGASGYDCSKPQKITIKANGVNPRYAQLMAVWCQQWAHRWTVNDTKTEFTFYYDETHLKYQDDDGKTIRDCLNMGKYLMDENLLSHFYWMGYRKRAKCVAAFNGATLLLANQTPEEEQGIGTNQKPEEWFFDECWDKWQRVLFPDNHEELWIKDEDFPIVRKWMKKEVHDDKCKAQTKKWGAIMAEKLAQFEIS